MKLRTSIILCLGLYFSSCQTCQEKNSEIAINHQEQSVKLITNLSETELKEMAKSSKIGRTLIHINSNTLNIISDGALTYSIFGNNNSVTSLQKRYGDLFYIDEQHISTEMYVDIQVVNILKYNNSFIKVYQNQQTGNIDIVSAKIVDKDIFLAFEIRIGQSKHDFFKKIFNDVDVYNLTSIDTISNGNELGEIQQQFIFKDEELVEVILLSDYDWILDQNE